MPATSQKRARDMSLPTHIARRIRDAIAEGGGLPIDEEARGHHAIALMGTIGSIWMLRADGTFWDADADFGKRLTPLPTQLHTTALVAGVGRFPWLAELLPVRPPSARDCPACGGRGILVPASSPPASSGLFCTHCHALGWRHEGPEPGADHSTVPFGRKRIVTQKTGGKRECVSFDALVGRVCSGLIVVEFWLNGILQASPCAAFFTDAAGAVLQIHFDDEDEEWIVTPVKEWPGVGEIVEFEDNGNQFRYPHVDLAQSLRLRNHAVTHAADRTEVGRFTQVELSFDDGTRVTFRYDFDDDTVTTLVLAHPPGEST